MHKIQNIGFTVMVLIFIYAILLKSDKLVRLINMYTNHTIEGLNSLYGN